MAGESSCVCVQGTAATLYMDLSSPPHRYPHAPEVLLIKIIWMNMKMRRGK